MSILCRWHAKVRLPAPGLVALGTGLLARFGQLGGNCRGNIGDRSIRTGFFDRIRDRVKDRNALMRRSAFARSDAAYDICAVFTHRQHVKCAFFSGDSLDDQTRIFIY